MFIPVKVKLQKNQNSDFINKKEYFVENFSFVLTHDLFS